MDHLTGEFQPPDETAVCRTLAPQAESKVGFRGQRHCPFVSTLWREKRALGTPENSPIAQGMGRKQAGQGLLCFVCCPKQEVPQWKDLRQRHVPHLHASTHNVPVLGKGEHKQLWGWEKQPVPHILLLPCGPGLLGVGFPARSKVWSKGRTVVPPQLRIPTPSKGEPFPACHLGGGVMGSLLSNRKAIKRLIK